MGVWDGASFTWPALCYGPLYQGVLCCVAEQVTRHVWDQAANKSVQQSEVLEVPIKAGWKAGTKITYAGVCSAAACR